MAVQDVTVGGVVYYGYSAESPEDWVAATNALANRLNTPPISTTHSSSEFKIRYSWMDASSHVIKLTPADANRGFAYTIYVTGPGECWAWISAASDVDVNAPNWNGRTIGDLWKTGQNGITTTASSVSIASVIVQPIATSGKKATKAYLISPPDSGVPYIYPNDATQRFTPYVSALSGGSSPSNARVSILGPIHATGLAGYTLVSKMLTQSTQALPPGSYHFSNSSSDTLKMQGVMANATGKADIFLVGELPEMTETTDE